MRAMGSSASELRGRDMCAGGIQVPALCDACAMRDARCAMREMRTWFDAPQGYRAGSRVAEEILAHVVHVA
jgi:hypothetical protein